MRAIIEEAALWLQSCGSQQWRWYLTDEGRASIRRRIETDEVYLVTCDGRDAATFSLQWSDRKFWGDDGEDGLAGYVHGLAVSRAFAGRGLGNEMLAFARREAAARGRSLLRLDCQADNARLCDVYRACGFIDRGVFPSTDGSYRFRRFERPVA